ncbi:TldD/PmbA family protein [Candidatus Woesearchaeota archaeon]|nr:TldD/PmbA family protein [Candidatus Woesearchaeota archaeon]
MTNPRRRVLKSATYSPDALFRALEKPLQQAMLLSNRQPVDGTVITLKPMYGSVHYRASDQEVIELHEGEDTGQRSKGSGTCASLILYSSFSPQGSGRIVMGLTGLGRNTKAIEQTLGSVIDGAVKHANMAFLIGLGHAQVGMDHPLVPLPQATVINYIQTPLENLPPIDNLALIVDRAFATHAPQNAIRSLTLKTDATAEFFIDSTGSRIYQIGRTVQVNLALQGLDRKGHPYAVEKALLFRDVADLERIVGRNAEKLSAEFTAKANPINVITGEYPVFLDGAAFGTYIHEAMAAHMLSGKYVTDGSSNVYQPERIGERVLPAWITIVDDPTLHDGKGSYRYDIEGTEALPVVLIEKGVLCNYLLDTTSAAALSLLTGKTYVSNGRARSDWAVAAGDVRDVEPRVTNVIIDAGDYAQPHREVEKMFQKAIGDSPRKLGIYVQGGGGQVDPTTGLFVLEPECAWLVDENGNMRALRESQVVAQVDALDRNVLAVSDKYGTGYGHCGAESGWVPTQHRGPAVLFKDIKVIGGSRDTRTAPLSHGE